MMHIAQTVAQAVETGRSGISVFLDAGTIALILTNSGLLVKALFDRKTIKAALDTAALAVKREKDADPVERPGESETCREHGEAISGLVEFKDNTGKALVRIEDKVDLLLGRKRP